MEGSTIKGTINGGKTASKIAIVLDSTSSIELTGNSYYTSLTNNGGNIITTSYEWEQVEEKEISRPSGGQGGPNGSGPGKNEGGPNGSGSGKMKVVQIVQVQGKMNPKIMNQKLIM